MRQNEISNSANRFRMTLTQMRDKSILIEHWKFLQTRTKKNLFFKKWINFVHNFRFYFRNAESVEYNFVIFEKLNYSIMNILTIHQKKKKHKMIRKMMLIVWIKNCWFLWIFKLCSPEIFEQMKNWSMMQWKLCLIFYEIQKFKIFSKQCLRSC